MRLPGREADRPALFMEQWAKKRMDSLDVLVDTEAMNSSRRTLYRVLDWLHDMRRNCVRIVLRYWAAKLSCATKERRPRWTEPRCRSWSSTRPLSNKTRVNFDNKRPAAEITHEGIERIGRGRRGSEVESEHAGSSPKRPRLDAPAFSDLVDPRGRAAADAGGGRRRGGAARQDDHAARARACATAGRC